MAIAQGTKFGKGYFQIGDGETVETFTTPCGFTKYSFNPAKKDTNSTVLPDCSDPDAAAWLGTQVVSLGWSFSADGVLDKTALPILESAGFSTAARSFRFRLVGNGQGSGTPDRLYQGTGHVEISSLEAARGDYYQISISVTGDGELTSSSVAAL
jgi:hypothetical protein